jgi:Ala-tRNA(Pro) deacylase
MTLKTLTQYLDRNKTKYTIVAHSPSFTAQEIAQSAHISGEEMAKTVIVWMDGAMAMVVLPASHMVDFTLLRTQSGAKDIELANESEFTDRFPDCEVGSMPPFGNLFNMKVFVASSLRERPEIAFNAGSHRELVKMSFLDFETLVQPTVASFTFRKKGHEEDIPASSLW